MAKSPQVRQYAGDIRLWEIQDDGTEVAVIADNDDPQFNQPVETNSMVFSYEAGDEVEVISKRRDSRYNQPVYSDTLPGTTDVTIELLELPPLILARILFGEGSTATVAAGSVTDEAHTVGASVGPIQLAYRYASAVVVEKGGTPLVLDTDYKLGTDNLRRGQVVPIDGGDIAAGDALTISYSYAAQVSTTIAGGAVPSKKFKVVGDVQDRISSDNGELRIPEATLTIDGDVDWLSDEPLTATLTGTCIVATGESSPYTFVSYKAA